MPGMIHATHHTASSNRTPTLGKRDVAALTRTFAGGTDAHGKVLPEAQEKITLLEERFASSFNRGARKAWQAELARIGATTTMPIEVPASDLPIWQKGPHPLANHPWATRPDAKLPARADVVIIGAGLTGAATAYALAEQLRTTGMTVVVLDQGDPATQASGRNGGNFELIPENFL